MCAHQEVFSDSLKVLFVLEEFCKEIKFLGDSPAIMAPIRTCSVGKEKECSCYLTDREGNE